MSALVVASKSVLGGTKEIRSLDVPSSVQAWWSRWLRLSTLKKLKRRRSIEGPWLSQWIALAAGPPSLLLLASGTHRHKEEPVLLFKRLRSQGFVRCRMENYLQEIYWPTGRSRIIPPSPSKPLCLDRACIYMSVPSLSGILQMPHRRKNCMQLK